MPVASRWLLMVALLVSGVGCGHANPPALGSPPHSLLTCSKAWARATTADALSAAVYLTLDNGGDSLREIHGGSCQRASQVELHRHQVDAQGIMHMQPLERLSVAAHGQVVLQPGGVHVMLIGLTQGLTSGETLSLILHGDDGDVPCEVRVLGPAAMGPDGD